MQQLMIVEKNGTHYADSRQVAEMVEVRHSDLMRSISTYIQILENAKLRSQDFFKAHSYKVEGNNKTYDCYLLTRKGCDMVANKMTGEKGVLFTAEYVTRFDQMERQLTTAPAIPQTFAEALRAAADLAEQNERLNQQMLLDRPKVVFAEALETSGNSILIGELAKLLSQNGIDIGQNRLYADLRAYGYLGKRGEYYNLPTQRSMNMKLFEIKTRTISAPSEHRNAKTTMVTGKGQSYFINKYKAAQSRAIQEG